MLETAISAAQRARFPTVRAVGPSRSLTAVAFAVVSACSPSAASRSDAVSTPQLGPAEASARSDRTAELMLEDIARAKDEYALVDFYAKSRRFLQLFPDHPDVDAVRYDLAIQLVTENLNTPDSEEAKEARALLDVLARDARTEATRFDAALLRLKFAPAAERQRLTEAILTTFAAHPDLDQVFSWWVEAALAEGDTETAGKWARHLLDRPGASDPEGILRDVVARAALIGKKLPKSNLLSRASGKVVLIDFFATWCAPCMAELPRLVELHAAAARQGLEIVSVSLDEDASALSEFLASARLPWRVVRSPRGSGGIADACGVSDLPTYFVLDRSGRVRATDLRRERLYQLIDALLAERSQH